MRKRIVISLVLFFLLTTIISKQKLLISKFNIKEIKIENNSIVKEKDIKKLLTPIYNENLLFLKNEDIERALIQNSFIHSFKVKKKYPSTLSIKIFEAKPIGILLNKKKKYYLSEGIELIDFTNLEDYQNLPYIFGNKEAFEKLYFDLLKINFPIEIIEKYSFFEIGRWDLKTSESNIIKLPSKNYLKSLKNYLIIRKEENFKKYKVFDYRLNNQLIMK